jgi:hypothetical protein
MSSSDSEDENWNPAASSQSSLLIIKGGNRIAATVHDIIVTTVAEGIAAFFWNFFVILAISSGGYSWPVIGLIAGVLHGALAHALGGVAVNPIFELALIMRRGTLFHVIPHLIAQFGGAAIAAVCVRFAGYMDITASVPTISLPEWAAMLLLMIGTDAVALVLMIVVKRGYSRGGAIHVGLAYAAAYAALGPTVSGCINPWFALVTSMVAPFWSVHCWVFYVGPVLGLIIAWATMFVLRFEEPHIQAGPLVNQKSM